MSTSKLPHPFELLTVEDFLHRWYVTPLDQGEVSLFHRGQLHLFPRYANPHAVPLVWVVFSDVVAVVVVVVVIFVVVVVVAVVVVVVVVAVVVVAVVVVFVVVVVVAVVVVAAAATVAEVVMTAVVA